MKAKIEHLSEMSKDLSVKSHISDNLLNLFGRFGLGRLLCRLSLEKQCGLSAAELILSLCLFRIHGQSIHSLYRQHFFELLSTGKNCYYRMLNRPTMDWRKLHHGMVSRFFAILKKEGAQEYNQPRCYIFDDTTLEKSGMHIECVSRVFDHVQGRCVLGYKLLLMAFFDGRTTLPIDFSIHREQGKKKDCGLSEKQLKAQYSKSRTKKDANSKRRMECDMSKMDSAISMLKDAWKNGQRASYTLCDSWFTCERLIAAVRKLGKGSVHFVGLAKMGNTKYVVNGRKRASNAQELIVLHERTCRKTCRKYKCHYIRLRGSLGTQPVQIFLIKYGRNENWNILLTSDMSLDFTKCFELYQIRWNVEVLLKENKSYLGLGSYQGRDLDGQIGDCTLCFITHIVMSLDKRFSDYETMGQLFAHKREELMALTLWKRILDYIAGLLSVLAETLGVTPMWIVERMMQDEQAVAQYQVVLEALEKYQVENKSTA